MFLIVGLGNPGRKFEKTRHNIGFKAVDAIGANFQFPIFKSQSIFNAQISKGEIGSEKVILVKPLTFMNESGQALKKLIGNLKLKIENLIIIHDDLDLPLGKIRISKGRSSAGHKGVQSLIKELKSKDFVRFRIGIKQPETKNRKQEIKDFVLQKFNKDEEKILKKIIDEIIGAIEAMIKNGVEKTQSEYNK